MNVLQVPYVAVTIFVRYLSWRYDASRNWKTNFFDLSGDDEDKVDGREVNSLRYAEGITDVITKTLQWSKKLFENADQESARYDQEISQTKTERMSQTKSRWDNRRTYQTQKANQNYNSFYITDKQILTWYCL